MLQIKNISKKYITGDLVQTALDNVSLNLRDNEFVAILGPSGSGKTTLLNIIGGLDRYDSGDLIINNISTKKYKDRDWDSYRNHTIGFVFQSYNLIPHQTILANVELALTISGISKKERKQRAIDALTQVGLGNQIHKKPTQMSGGQMQRVAIARALVNNPDILLADEPTGALDSDTSIQVMDLLKEVAKDRLVVMVTHNPELAEQYATRIVRLKDGKIQADSDPFLLDGYVPHLTHQNMGKASMSFLTSLGLSFNNLLTKKARTILTAFAGSIGIIGIALILSLSNGVETYIQQIEEDTLSEYPLQITTNAIDLSSLLESADTSHEDLEDLDVEVREISTMSSMLSQSKINDLKSLKEYLESDECDIYSYANAVEYKYSITPYIYQLTDTSYRKVNPSEIFSSMMGSSSLSSTYSSYMTVFNQMPESEKLYKEQYDVMAGRWPENDYELVVVLSSAHTVSDFTLYACGLKDSSELTEMMQQYMSGQTVSNVSTNGTYKYNDFIGIEFSLVDIADLYEYDEEYNLYVDKSDNESYMQSVVENGQKLEIVGVVMPKDSDSAAMLTSGINYPSGLTQYIINHAQNSEIVQKQLDNPSINVFTGEEFVSDEDNSFDLSSMFSVDTSVLENMFNMDTSNLNLDFSNISIDTSNMDLSGMDYSNLFSNINIQINSDKVGSALTNILNGYLSYGASDPSTNYSALGSALSSYLQSEEALSTISSTLQSSIGNISAALPDTNSMLSSLSDGFGSYVLENNLDDMTQITTYFNNYLQSEGAQSIINSYTAGINDALESEDIASTLLSSLYNSYEAYASANDLPQMSKMTSSLQDYLNTSQGQAAMNQAINDIINLDDIENQLAASMGNVMSGYSTMMANMMNSMANQITDALTSYMSAISSGMNIDPDALENMFSFNMDSEDFTDLMTSMMSSEESASYSGNLSKLNYADLDKPDSINIYPKDFDSKAKIIDILDNYNAELEAKGEDDKVITYTDYVGLLMNSVTDIIDTISYVLIAFVAISLVVSSIMIGIITYISVLERTKEIGILRAIGASKANVSQVFNAETFLIGLLSGVLGIGISALLLIPANAIIHMVTGNYNVNAILPVSGAIALIFVAIILTLVGGLIPARGAAKKDPVLALRSE